jgi:hypothetical protein
MQSLLDILKPMPIKGIKVLEDYIVEREYSIHKDLETTDKDNLPKLQAKLAELRLLVAHAKAAKQVKVHA